MARAGVDASAKERGGDPGHDLIPAPVALSRGVQPRPFRRPLVVLVIRDFFPGRQRFKEFVAAPEGIPTNILSERLERLREHGVVELTGAADGSPHPAYRLTAKGRGLGPVLAAVRDWGLKWEKGTQVLRSGAG